MTVVPGPVSYTEGEELRDSISTLLSRLADIENASTAATNKDVAWRLYRMELRSTVEKATDLLRSIHSLAPYVGGERASVLKGRFDSAAIVAEKFRSDPTEPNLREMIAILIDSIRAAFDLVLLGSAVTAAHEQTSRTIEAAEKKFDAQHGEVTTIMAALASKVESTINGAAEMLQGEADRLIAEISSKGTVTIAETRKEVAGVLVSEAAKQFSEAQKWLNWQVFIWAMLSAGGVAAFLWTAQRFLMTQVLPPEWTWQIAFFAGMRAILLGGIAASASFCLRMLKGQIALAQLNAHRTRVARSMPGLLHLAPEAERVTVLQSIIQSVIGVRESVISDTSQESLLAAVEVVEKVAKAAKG
jgi:hypothetical protein